MQELRGLDVEGEAFETTFGDLMDVVAHHVEEEENEMFPEAEQILAEQLEALLDDMLALKARVTTT